MRRLFLLALLVGCSSRTASPSSESRALLARFPTLPAGAATIERDGERFHPRVAQAHASVSLPVRADGPFSIANGVKVDVRLREARASLGEVVDGWVVYRGGVEGGAIFQRPDAEGTEDHVLAASPRTLSYDVDVHGAGVRWVDSVIEILDAGGAPRIRMNAPTLIDAQGKKHAARVSVSGCPVDRSAASPWGRTFSPADRCTISIAWDPTLPHPVLVDPAWTATASMSTPRLSATAIALSGGKVLVAGGISQISPKVVESSAELFDPSTKTWASAGSMGIRREAHALATMGTKALVVGASPATSFAESYDPSAGWSSVAALPVAVTKPAAVDLGTKVFVVGGGTSASELFDPTAGTWSSSGSMAVSRSLHQAHLLSTGKVLAYGGGGISSAEIWDGSTWSDAGSTSTPYAVSVRLPGDQVLAFAGRTLADTTSTAELWSASTWSATGSLGGVVSLPSAVVLPSGAALITGGFGASGVISTVSQWNAGTWTSASSLGTARIGHVAVGLSGGSVLVAGGQVTGGETSGAEILGALATGAACTTAVDCATGPCLGGFCCATTCPAATCDMGKAVVPTCDATGACGTTSVDCGLYSCDSGACRTTCAADADCGSTAFCGGSACVAKKANGATAADPKECTSGFVGDGVCCDKACDGVCESCATGTCTAVMGAPKHGSCPAPGADPCSATSCDGTDGKSCKRFAGSEVSCRTASCDTGVETQASQCDGSGTCPAAVTKECGAYACDGPACRRTCRSDVDCSKGSTCDTITHECLAADTCDGDHTIHSHSGADKDCSPYKCSKTDCLKECTASTACVEGFVCDTTLRQCVPPTTPNPDAGDSGGCGMSRSTETSFPLLFLALLALPRRMSRKRGPRA